MATLIQKFLKFSTFWNYENILSWQLPYIIFFLYNACLPGKVYPWTEANSHLHLKQPALNYFIPKLWIQILKTFMLHIWAELIPKDVLHSLPKLTYNQT